MRLGRPLALAAAAVLVAGITAPAHAENSSTPPAAPAGDSATGFTLNDVNETISPTGSYTFSGKGCVSNGVPGTVHLGIGNNDETFTSAGNAKAKADGTWSLPTDIAQAIAKSGGDAKIDPWFVAAQCFYYDGSKSELKFARFDLTPTSGKVKTTHAADKEVTEIRVTGEGFNPGVTVTFTLSPSDETGKVQEGATGIPLGTTTVDANGAFETTLTAPASIPDGYYVITVKTPNGDSGSYEAVYKAVNNRLYFEKGLNHTESNGGNLSGDNNGKGDDNQPQPPAAQNAAAKEPAKAAPKKNLARTGVAAPAVALLAVGMVGAGTLALKRRKA